MDLVVDTNILLACFKSDSATRRLISVGYLHLFVPEHQVNELKSYIPHMKNKYKLSDDFAEMVVTFIYENVEIVPKSTYSKVLEESKRLLLDQDDAPILALAFVLNIPIWSNDPDLKQQNMIATYTTRDIVDRLKEIADI